jgi:hypothetical protein
VINLVDSLLGFRVAITFFFGIAVFLYENENPVDHETKSSFPEEGCGTGVLILLFIRSKSRTTLELQRIRIHGCPCNERLKIKMRELNASNTLGCAGMGTLLPW